MDVAMTAICVSARVTIGTVHAPLMQWSPSRGSPRARARSRPQRTAARHGRGLRPAPGLAPDPAHRFRLAADVGEEGRVSRPLQALLDERPHDDLHAHRNLQRRHGAAGETPRAIDEVSRQDDQHTRFVFEHSVRSSGMSVISYIRCINYFLALLWNPVRVAGSSLFPRAPEPSVLPGWTGVAADAPERSAPWPRSCSSAVYPSRPPRRSCARRSSRSARWSRPRSSPIETPATRGDSA